MSAAPILVRPAPLPVPTPRVLPDVVRHGPALAEGRLERVGMSGIHAPVRVRDAHGRPMLVPGRVGVFVSLDDAQAKGIHMSRLFLLVQEALAKQELSPASLEQLLRDLVQSHASTSRSAQVEAAFDYLVERPSLVSGNTGWKSYPVIVRGELARDTVRTDATVTVPYSSTCPCSAALARQLIQEEFLRVFPPGRAIAPEAVAAWLGTESGVCATPHSQRSLAEVRVALAPGVDTASWTWLLDDVESALGTPVQAAVKREDEQAFAKLNGENLMFCEDAARRVKRALERDPRIADYRIRVEHQESLHAHDAVAVAVKGVPGGFRA